MTRTLPNRLAAHASAIPSVAYADAIADAVTFLHAQLRHPDTAVGMAAAMALLDLEKTRIRHGQPLPHIAAGLPADDATTESETALEGPMAIGSPADVLDTKSPAGKPAAICGTPMTLDDIMADPEMLEVIRQTRREMERADPGAPLTDESFGRMIFARMSELRSSG